MGKAKERIILGMSIMDVFFSSACAMSSFMGPSYLQDQLESVAIVVGNDTTCNFQGWLYQFGGASSLYNACLCLHYYLVTVGRKQKRDESKWNKELMFHAIILLWATLSASAGVWGEMYAYIGFQGCYFASLNYDGRCEDNPEFPECHRRFTGDGNVVMLFLSVCPLILSITVILVSLILIYCHVRKVENKANRWRMNSNIMAATANIDAEMATSNPSLSTSSGRSRGNKAMSERVYETAVLYAFAFFITYTPAFISIFWNAKTNGIAPLQLVAFSLLPFQGFWNWFIYTRGRVHGIKQENSTLTTWQAIKVAMFVW